MDDVQLSDTQAYLKARLQNMAPNSVLSAAWDEFYRVYSELVRRFALSCGVPKADLDDCVQNVWRDVIDSLPRFQHNQKQSGLRSWMYTLTRSKATNLIRRRAKRSTQSLDTLRGSGYEPSDECDRTTTDEHQWERETLRTVLAELRDEVSDVNYRVLHLRLIEGCAVRDVALSLGLTPQQVWYRQHRTLKKLRVLFNVYAGRPFDDDLSLTLG